MSFSEFFGAMNVIGLLAVVGFLAGCAGAVASYLALRPHTKLGDDGYRTWDADNPEAQKRFRIFVGFCAFGVLSGVVGFWLGDWPQG